MDDRKLIIPKTEQLEKGVYQSQHNKRNKEVQKHREELELLELQIQQEQMSGGHISININNNLIEERKVNLSQKRFPLSNSNKCTGLNDQSNQINNIENVRLSNQAPVKSIINKRQQIKGVNRVDQINFQMSQTSQESIIPIKNSMSKMIIKDHSQLKKQMQSYAFDKLEEYQPLKYPQNTNSSPLPIYRTSVNSQYAQIQQQGVGKQEGSYSQLSSYPTSTLEGQNIVDQQFQQGKQKNKYYMDQSQRGNNNVYPVIPNNSYNNVSNNYQFKQYINQGVNFLNPEIQQQLPHSLKELSIVKLPNEDVVHFDELDLLTEAFLVDKYSEFMNNDNDLFYLEGNFSRLYSSSVQNFFESQQKESFAFKGALSVCFDTQNPKADYRHIHPNYKVSLKKIANNPMIYAGLASQQSHPVNLNELNLNNQKIEIPQSEYNFKAVNQKIVKEEQNNFSDYENLTAKNQLGSREGTKVHNSQNIINSNNASRAHTNSTNTNQNFFNRKNFSIPQITSHHLMNELMRVQSEYRTHKVVIYKIFIVTKFKVRIDLGFIQVSLNMNSPNQQKTYSHCIIHRLYISRIYRKLNYAHFIYLQVYNFLLATYPNLDKIQITLSNNSSQYLKFKQQIGFRLENIKSPLNSNIQSQQIRLVLKRSDFAQIFTHLQSKKFIEKPGLNKPFLGMQNKIPDNNLIPPYLPSSQ